MEENVRNLSCNDCASIELLTIVLTNKEGEKKIIELSKYEENKVNKYKDTLKNILINKSFKNKKFKETTNGFEFDPEYSPIILKKFCNSIGNIEYKKELMDCSWFEKIEFFSKKIVDREVLYLF